MPAILQYDIWADQRVTLNRPFVWSTGSPAVPVDLTGCKARLEAKDASGNVVIDLSTANGGIALGGTAGTITLTASETAMGAIAVGNYAYDLLITMSDGVAVTKFASGVWYHTITQTVPL